MARRAIRRLLGFGGRVRPEVGGLIVATVLASLACSLAGGSGHALYERLAFAPHRVLRGEAWRLLTGPLVDDEPVSLLGASLTLYWFGRDLAVRWGGRALLARWFAVSLAANAVTTVAALVVPSVRGQVYLGGWPAAAALMVGWAGEFRDQEMRLGNFLPVHGGRVLALVVIGLTAVLAIRDRPAAYAPHLAAETIAAVYTGLITPRALRLGWRKLGDSLWRRRRPRRRWLRAVGDRDREPRRKYWN